MAEENENTQEDTSAEEIEEHGERELDFILDIVSFPILCNGSGARSLPKRSCNILRFLSSVPR